MCGVTGIWSFNGPPIHPETIERFNNSLSHRGPDGSGIYFDNNDHLSLGHRRLAILDLSESGSQPMSYSNERYWITFNGEIYNFLELREELKAKGHEFRTETDTEVLLAAYAEWGLECQNKLNGMWAFAIWDTLEQKMFLSRDRFGIKPLYYFANENQFIFASEIKAFLSLPYFDRSFNHNVIAGEILHVGNFAPSELCFYNKLKQLRAGHCLYVTAQNISEERWWHLNEHISQREEYGMSEVEEFKNLFFDSCRLRMRSDVPVATCLSGGLDSSSIVCALDKISQSSTGTSHRQAKTWNHVFIAQYPRTSQDETKYANMVVESTQTIPHYIDINEKELIGNLSDTVFSLEGIGDIHIGPFLVHKEQKEHGMIVSLDGHGGDELLYGYHGFPLDNIKKLETLASNVPSFMLINALKSLHQLDEIPSSWLRRAPIMHKPTRSQMEVDLLKNLHPIVQCLYGEIHDYPLINNLHDFDRCSMAHGVESRTPFLDWRLVAFAMSLPPRALFDGQYTKKVLRESMKDLLTEEIRLRKSKIGFSNPIASWLKGGLKDLMLDTVSSQDFLESDIWDGHAIRNITQKSYSSSIQLQTLERVWPYICAMMLIRRFK